MRLGYLRAVPAALLLVACGTNRPVGSGGDIPSVDAGVPDAGDMPDAGETADAGEMPFVPAAHAPPPQVVTLGGPVLASPKVVPVFFAGDDASTRASVLDFLSRLGPSEYWSAATAEYGVGPVVSTDPVDLVETVGTNVSDADIESWLAGKLNSDDPAFPAADDNSIYLLHYPKGVTIVMDGSRSCIEFGAYHGNIALDQNHQGRLVAYAVLPRCPDLGNLNELESLTSSESHEIIEAATDPFPETDPAFAQADDSHLEWEYLFGGSEVADMCAQGDASFVAFPPDLPYVVQRSWSNKAAMAGHDPCVPALPGDIYFNAVPELDDDLTANLDGARVVKGVKIPVGESKQIDVDLFSDSDTGGPWDVRALDWSTVFGTGSPRLEFTFDQTSGQNGDKLHMTIKALHASGSSGISLFLMISTRAGVQQYWIGAVGN